MFKDYQSKPVVRRAYEVTAHDHIEKVDESTSTLTVVSGEATDKAYEPVTFKHYESVKAGDFIVYVKRDDIYHCPREAFLAHNKYPAKEL